MNKGEISSQQYGEITVEFVNSRYKIVSTKLAEKAGVKKKINPHAFRHARATHLASKLTEAQMKELFGWVQSSDMASIYVHLSGRDVDNALLRLHGLAKNRDDKDGVMNLKICPRCGERNDPVSNFCKRCASPLDSKVAVELEEMMKRKDKVVARVIEIPDKKTQNREVHLRYRKGT